MRGLFLLLTYGLFLFGGTLIIMQRTPAEPVPALSATFFAARDLAANTRLQQQDIAAKPSNDYFLRIPLMEGEQIANANLSPIPRLDAAPDLLSVAIPVDPQTMASGGVIAGRNVRVCPADVVVPVETVLCDGSACLAIVELDIEDVTASAAALAGAVRPTPPSRPCR